MNSRHIPQSLNPWKILLVYKIFGNLSSFQTSVHFFLATAMLDAPLRTHSHAHKYKHPRTRIWLKCKPVWSDIPFALNCPTCWPEYWQINKSIYEKSEIFLRINLYVRIYKYMYMWLPTTAVHSKIAAANFIKLLAIARYKEASTNYCKLYSVLFYYMFADCNKIGQTWLTLVVKVNSGK